MLLWVILGCLTAIVLFFLLGPLYRARSAERERAAFDAAVYGDQLGEVESDRERGLIEETKRRKPRGSKLPADCLQLMRASGRAKRNSIARPIGALPSQSRSRCRCWRLAFI